MSTITFNALDVGNTYQYGESNNTLFDGTNKTFDTDTDYTVTFSRTSGKLAYYRAYIADSSGNILLVFPAKKVSNGSQITFNFPSSVDYTDKTLFIRGGFTGSTTTTYDVTYRSGAVNNSSIVTPQNNFSMTINNSNVFAIKSNAGYKYTSDNPPTVIVKYSSLSATYKLSNNSTIDTSQWFGTISFGNAVLTGNPAFEFAGNPEKTGDTPSTSIPATIINNMTGFTLDTSITDLTYNATTTITVTPLTDYTVTTIPHLTVTSDSSTWFDADGTLQDNGSYAFQLKPTSYYTSATLTLTGEATGTAPSETSFPVTSYDTSDLQNMTLTNQPSTMTVNKTTTFTIVVNSGYQVVTAPALRIAGDAEVLFDANGTLTSAGTYTFSVTPTHAFTSVTVVAQGVAEKTTEITESYPLISVYHVDKTTLNTIQHQRFYSLSSSGTTEDIDLSKYVLYLYKLYVPITESEETEIYLGTFDMGLTSPTVSNRFSTVTTDAYQITEKYKNAIDYDAIVKIYLPFIGWTTLDTSDVMSKTVKVEYITEIPTGNSIANIYADNVIINTFTCLTKFEQPYNSGNVTNADIVNAINNQEYFDLNIKLLVEYPILADANVPIINTTDETTLASNFTGYVRGNIVKISTIATSAEQSEIESMLSNGIILP